MEHLSEHLSGLSSRRKKSHSRTTDHAVAQRGNGAPYDSVTVRRRFAAQTPGRMRKSCGKTYARLCYCYPDILDLGPTLLVMPSPVVDGSKRLEEQMHSCFIFCPDDAGREHADSKLTLPEITIRKGSISWGKRKGIVAYSFATSASGLWTGICA